MKTIRNNRKNEHDDIFQAFIVQTYNYPLLTFEEELELSRRIKNGDSSARHRLIESNLRLVVKIAYGYYVKKIPFMDLIQEGNLGLIRAVDKYDYSMRVRFSTYAAWWVKIYIARYLAVNRRTVRLPYSKEKMYSRIQQASNVLSQLYMRQPTVDEIAEEIDIPRDKVDFILGFAQESHSLDAMNESNDTNSDGFLVDFTYSPEQVLIEKNSRETTLGMLNNLKEREKNVIIYRYQLNGENRYTLKSISRKMGISMEAIRQLENRALRKLRKAAEELRDLASCSSCCSTTSSATSPANSLAINL